MFVDVWYFRAPRGKPHTKRKQVARLTSGVEALPKAKNADSVRRAEYDAIYAHSILDECKLNANKCGTMKHLSGTIIRPIIGMIKT
jgi:hypothetical protein